jgi:hypothetical protein
MQRWVLGADATHKASVDHELGVVGEAPQFHAMNTLAWPGFVASALPRVLAMAAIASGKVLPLPTFGNSKNRSTRWRSTKPRAPASI